jgi:hypothetical protein
MQINKRRGKFNSFINFLLLSEDIMALGRSFTILPAIHTMCAMRSHRMFAKGQRLPAAESLRGSVTKGAQGAQGTLAR